MLPNKSQPLVIPVTENIAGLRLDHALAQVLEIGTRSRAETLINSGAVTIDGRSVKKSFILKTAQSISITFPDFSNTPIEPWFTNLDIIFEDKYLLVVHKPYGMVTHPSAGHEKDSLVNALIAQNIPLSMGFNEARPGIIHRLDKDTSGLLVVAKNNSTHTALAKLFADREIQRSYRSIVIGDPKVSSGIIESRLIRKPNNRFKYHSLPKEEGLKGKQAITYFKVLKSKMNLHLMSCHLKTGRTHQIRVHMSEQNLPILGDPLYGRKYEAKHINTQIFSEYKKYPRMYLHATELGFTHPITGLPVHCQAPWPQDVQPFINFLGFSEPQT